MVDGRAADVEPRNARPFLASIQNHVGLDLPRTIGARNVHRKPLQRSTSDPLPRPSQEGSLFPREPEDPPWKTVVLPWVNSVTKLRTWRDKPNGSGPAWSMGGRFNSFVDENEKTSHRARQSERHEGQKVVKVLLLGQEARAMQDNVQRGHEEATQGCPCACSSSTWQLPSRDSDLWDRHGSNS